MVEAFPAAVARTRITEMEKEERDAMFKHNINALFEIGHWNTNLAPTPEAIINFQTNELWG